MFDPQPQEQHAWLAEMMGSWSLSGQGYADPSQPPFTFKGTEVVRPMGSLWVVCEASFSTTNIGESQTLMTLGFDPASDRFVGSWAGTMMTCMFHYAGQLDESNTLLTLETEGPNLDPDAPPGSLAWYHDIIERVSDSHRILRSRVIHDDGTHTQLMEAHYLRS